MKKNLLMVFIIIAAFAMISVLPVSGDSAQDYKVIKKASNTKSSGEVQWFKLNVYDKKEKKNTVKITIPLSLIEIFADKDDKVKIVDNNEVNVKEVLSLLKKNGPMTLVEIEKDDQVVKIWLE
jgi:spore coat protein CotF